MISKENTSIFKIFFGGLCSLSLTMGISRFSYTPLLPVMQNETNLGIASGGFLATIHYLGYLLGVLIAFKTESIKARERFYFWGLFFSVVSTFTMAVSENYLIWSTSRFVAGFCGAAGIIIGAGLVMQWISENTKQKPQMGKYYAGAALGIVISACGSIFFEKFNLPWNAQWQSYSLIALILFFPAWFLRPKLIDKHKLKKKSSGLKKDNLHLPDFFKLMVMYFFSGFAFVVSATFTVAIVQSNFESQNIGSLAWLVVGIAGIPSVIAWDKVENKIGMQKALCFAIIFHIISLLLSAFFINFYVLLLSALFFGISHLGIVSLTMTIAGRESPKNPGREMAKLTIAFALALVFGPFISGIIAQQSGTYFYPLVLSACMLSCGIILMLSRKRKIV